MKEQKQNWEQEFERLGGSTEIIGDYDRIIMPEGHLLRINDLGYAESYPESPYELDPAKVKQFIGKQRKEACLEIIEYLEKKDRPDTWEDREFEKGYNRAIECAKEYLDSISK